MAPLRAGGVEARGLAHQFAAGTPVIDSVASGEWRGSAMNAFHWR